MGLGLTAYVVAVERGLLAREEALRRSLSTLRFAASRQGPEPDATGHHGFYYYFLDMESGWRAWSCELSTIDSTLLLAGVLGVGIQNAFTREHGLDHFENSRRGYCSHDALQRGRPRRRPG